ncbi:MAG: type II/IV secretion system ATPase subunit [Petrotogales bacterium]
MTAMGQEEVKKLLEENPHLKQYLENIKDKVGKPDFYSELDHHVREEHYPNLIYRTEGVVFAHIYKTKNMKELEYKAIEPVLTDAESEKRKQIMKLILKKVPEKKSLKTEEELKEVIKELINEITVVDERAEKVKLKKKGRILGKKRDTIKLTSDQKKNIEYFIIKELVGGGAIECFMRDPYIEDIHVVAGENVHLVHRIFEMIKTNIIISQEEAPTFVKMISEKMGVPVSEGRPIVDGILPDGSRGNIIYSKSVSLKGPSMTLRRYTETPISVTQLINWGTIDAGIGAYLWLSLQYGRNFFLCGGTACGKTTTMNAIVPFIPPEKKIYTAESTPELLVPHSVWQRLLTKTSGPKESHVDLFGLLKASLRSRPDYIIPGEIRGPEGNIVFQVMQTGHACMTTFHAGSVTKVIQRLTGDPINVPKTFMDNLDFILIQLAVEQRGKMLRRCTSIDEIEGYNREIDGIISRKAFEWKPEQDFHIFTATNNSFVLEEKIARNAGYQDTSKIYDEHKLRKIILQKMVEEKIFDYYKVVECIWGYYREGKAGLPFYL